MMRSLHALPMARCGPHLYSLYTTYLHSRSVGADSRTGLEARPTPAKRALQALQHAAECLGDKWYLYHAMAMAEGAREIRTAPPCVIKRSEGEQWRRGRVPRRCGQLAEALASARSLEGLGLGIDACV